MSMLPYESAQQRDVEPQSQSHCVLIFSFFSPGAGITSLAHCQKCFVGCSRSQGLSDALSPFGNATYRTAEPSHWLFPDWWLLRWKGNPLKGRWWGLKEWIPKLKAWMKDMRETHNSRGKSQPQMHFNLELFYFYSYFSNMPDEQRKRGATTFSHNSFDLTKKQSITMKLIIGLTVTECNVLH